MQVWARLKLLFTVGRGVMIGHEKIQVAVLDDDPPPDVDRVEPYGYSYRPKKGCQAYLLFPSGDRTRGFAIVCGDRQYQMRLEEGEVAIHDDQGNYACIMRDGTIHVKASKEVLADTPLFRTTQNAEVGGNLVVKGTTQSNGGFYGTGGAAAEMKGGAKVTGEFTVNDKNVSDTHTHDCECGRSSGVN